MKDECVIVPPGTRVCVGSSVYIAVENELVQEKPLSDVVFGEFQRRMGWLTETKGAAERRAVFAETLAKLQMKIVRA